VVRTVDDLSPGTDALVAASGANFNYGREFLRAYELYPIQPVQDRYYIELLGPDGDTVAYAPCFVQGDPLGAFGMAKGEYALLSSVWHCSDTRLVAIDPTPTVAAEMLDAMRDVAARAGLRRAGFINVAVGSPTAQALEGAGLTGIHLDTRYWLDLARYGSEDGVLAAIKSGDRREYRRHWRRATEAGATVVIRDALPDEDVRKLELLEVTMVRVGSPGYYDAGKLRKFLAETPSAKIVEVTLAGQLLAYAIVFVDDTRMHAWALGYDREQALPFSPYYLVWGSFIQLGYRLQVPRLEAGRRNGEFKTRYGLVGHELNAYLTHV
jgi:CelD/BcsL family acetyltransferase involved in cellulose biosynthesis